LKNITIGDITPLTSIDFPGRLAAIFFTQGCSWRCPYCYNASLQAFKLPDEGIPFEEIKKFLEERKGFLDGVVFGGGEPTEQAGLRDLMSYVKDRGYEVALHTNGVSSEKLKGVLPLCNWVAMDIKAPFSRYDEITKVKNTGSEPSKSARLIIESGIEYEFRTTYHPELLSEEDLLEIARELSRMGAKHYVIQAFHSQGCPDSKLKDAHLPKGLISEKLKEEIKKLIPKFEVRE
jgi:pyruvate formate lyase activating enzyme